MSEEEKAHKIRTDANIEMALREYMEYLDHLHKRESNPVLSTLINNKMWDLNYWYGQWVGDEAAHIWPEAWTQEEKE